MDRKCKICDEEKDLNKFVKGQIYKGIQYYKYKCKECLNKSLRTGKPNTGIFQKGNKINLGRKHNDEFKKQVSEFHKGRKQSPELIEKRRQKTLARGKGRQSNNYEIWRKKVLERDNYECVKCGSKNTLHCHHLIPWKEDNSKRFEIDNGQTLCASCHMKEGFVNGELNSSNTQFKKGLKPWNKGLKKVNHGSDCINK